MLENKMKKKSGKERGLAISQIVLLIVSIIAISYVFGEGVGLVSAQGPDKCIKSAKTGQEFKVSEIDPRTWCDGNGGREVCTYSPHKLRNDKKYTCPSAQRGDTDNQNRVVVPNLIDAARAGDRILGEADPEIPGGDIPVMADAPPAKLGTKEVIIGFAKDAGIALTIYYGGRYILNQIPGISPELADSFAASAAVGYSIKTIAIPLWNKLNFLVISGPWGWVVMGVAMVLTFIFTYKKTKYVVIVFSCYPWDALSGGEDCEECNKQGILSCGEYQCRSLGRSCGFLSNEELCYWNNTGDVSPPIIQPWEDILTPEYIYAPDNAISPPDRGVKIVREDGSGCVVPFTRLRFGVTLDEPAKCKIDADRERTFEDMSLFFGGSSTDKYNHSHTLSIPSPDSMAEQNITLQNDGEFSLYTRCEDTQGNSNAANFVFRFCVDEGPDTFPPLIEETSILNGMPIGFNQTSIDLEVYVNEPAECRWSHLDRSYDDMETDMSCSTNVIETNARLLYQCSTTLTGLKDGVDNDFYFRCEDQPHLEGTDREGDRNKNPSSYKFTLVGTRPLVIDSVGPNETVRDSTDLVKVPLEAETSAGFKEGAATCYFSNTGAETSFVRFFETGTHKHTQDLWLSEGDYTYYIRCVDLGGNSDSATTSFRVESDSTAPVVVRAYHEENYLKIITNEKAECVYDTVDCSYLFEDGIGMNVVDGTEHFTNWDTNNNFYIKCQDEFGNKPFPNQCSIIARPFEI